MLGSSVYGPLKCVINKRGTIAVNVCRDDPAMMIVITEGEYRWPIRSKKVWAGSPWKKELCAALRMEWPFARTMTEARQTSMQFSKTAEIMAENDQSRLALAWDRVQGQVRERRLDRAVRQATTRDLRLAIQARGAHAIPVALREAVLFWWRDPK